MKHDEVRVINALRKKGITVNQLTKVINIAEMHDAGNGTWGKLDFLVNHCGYIMTKYSKVTKNIKEENDITVINKKEEKREQKINIVRNVKNILKNGKVKNKSKL